MNHQKYLLLLALLSVAALLAPSAAVPLQAATTYVSDTFTRNVTDSWGSTNPGGTYTLSGKAGNFDVPDVVGQISVGANKTFSAYLPINARDVDIKVRTKRDKAVANASHIAYFVARRTADGTNYLGRIRYGTDGTVRLQAVAQVGGTQTLLGGEKTVTGLTTAPETYIWLRGQVTGSNPTTIRLKAWADGQTEPANWQYTVTDSTPALQVAGGTGLRAYLGTGATNAPVLFLFDDFTVTDASVAPPPPSIYWGALVQGKAPSPQNLAAGGPFDTFEQRAGKKMAILHWGQPWKMNNTFQPFQTDYFTAVRNRGSIPFLDWSSWHLSGGVNQPDFQLNDIYNGTYDSYITQWALAAKAWGKPFFLRLDWEMNGNWQFSWSEQLNGNQPGDYIKMWRHVHDIFTQNGVTNITWVWCPNISGSTTLPLSSLYPGDAYVDWTCLDGYNKYSTWLNFNQVYNGVGINWLYASYNEMLSVAPNKPIIIGEVASLEAGDGGTKKAAWIRDAYLTQLPQYFPKIKGVLWFNWDDGSAANTYPIESSQPSIDAFAQSVAAPYYPANLYSNLNTSPIPPLQ